MFENKLVLVADRSPIQPILLSLLDLKKREHQLHFLLARIIHLFINVHQYLIKCQIQLVTLSVNSVPQIFIHLHNKNTNITILCLQQINRIFHLLSLYLKVLAIPTIFKPDIFPTIITNNPIFRHINAKLQLAAPLSTFFTLRLSNWKPIIFIFLIQYLLNHLLYILILYFQTRL